MKIFNENKKIIINVIIALAVIVAISWWSLDTPSVPAAGANLKDKKGSVNTDKKLSVQTPNEPVKLKNVKVRALYLTGHTVNKDDDLNHFIELAKKTEINSYVVDIKDDDGKIGYATNIPLAKEVNGWQSKYNPEKVIKEFHKNGIYVIGRLVCFKDPILANQKLDRAIQSTKGGVWRDRKGLAWLNPYNKDNWEYIVEVAKEALAKGFDEIQFDYVRFSNDGVKSTMDFSQYKQKRHEIIDEFLAFARKSMPGEAISADVFGIICESPGDTEDIGQNLEYIGRDIDAISPMVYPSHYASGQYVNKVLFIKPDLEPYGVVYNTLLRSKDRISKVPNYKVKVRPYLQNFDAKWLGKGYWQEYGVQQVKQQIKAVYDAGYEEWILWDPSNTYSEEALEVEGYTRPIESSKPIITKTLDDPKLEGAKETKIPRELAIPK